MIDSLSQLLAKGSWMRVSSDASSPLLVFIELLLSLGHEELKI